MVQSPDQHLSVLLNLLCQGSLIALSLFNLTVLLWHRLVTPSFLHSPMTPSLLMQPVPSDNPADIDSSQDWLGRLPFPLSNLLSTLLSSLSLVSLKYGSPIKYLAEKFFLLSIPYIVMTDPRVGAVFSEHSTNRSECYAPINVMPHHPPPGLQWGNCRGIDMETDTPYTGIWYFRPLFAYVQYIAYTFFFTRAKLIV